MAEGKVVASYLVRVTLRDSAPDEVQAEGPVEAPTNARLESWIKEAIDRSSDFVADDIRVSAERTDR